MGNSLYFYIDKLIVSSYKHMDVMNKIFTEFFFSIRTAHYNTPCSLLYLLYSSPVSKFLHNLSLTTLYVPGRYTTVVTIVKSSSFMVLVLRSSGVISISLKVHNASPLVSSMPPIHFFVTMRTILFYYFRTSFTVMYKIITVAN